MAVDRTMYLDYAAATPLDPTVRDAMRAYEDVHFANAFSVHGGGREAKRVLEDARFGIARQLGVRSHECFFASGATDAMTKALYSAVNGMLEQGRQMTDLHIVVSVLEHATVRSCVEGFARRGARVTVVGATPAGIIDLAQVRDALRDDTAIVVCMLVNNELGTIQPVRDLRTLIDDRFAGARAPLLIVDASQAPLSMPVTPEALGADFFVIDAAKFYGPKKTALLHVRSGTPFQSLCGVPGKVPSEGTADVAAALGMRVALDIAAARRHDDAARWHELKTRLIAHVTQRFPSARINGDPERSIPNIVNMSFPGVEAEFLASQLDASGIAVSAKSACLSGGGEGSYVVAAVDPERANSAIRISFGRETTEEDVDTLVSVLADIVNLSSR